MKAELAQKLVSEFPELFWNIYVLESPPDRLYDKVREYALIVPAGCYVKTVDREGNLILGVYK